MGLVFPLSGRSAEGLNQSIDLSRERSNLEGNQTPGNKINCEVARSDGDGKREKENEKWKSWW